MPLIVTNRQLQKQLDAIAAKVDILMTQQDDINADVQTIETAVANLGTAAAAIQAEIAALQQANPSLDLSGLDKAAADITAAAAAISAIPPAS